MAAATPLTDIRFPSEKDMRRMVAATTNIASAGGASTATITIPNEYPAIDRSIPHPVLAILLFQNGATLAAEGVENFEISMQCDGGTLGADEFKITGDRTIDVYQTADEAQDVIIFYIARGTGAKR